MTILLALLKSFGIYLFQKGGWKVALVVIFSIAGLWGYNEYNNVKQELKDCKGATPTVTPRDVPLPPVTGQAEGQTVEPPDTSAFHHRINSILATYRRAQDDSLAKMTRIQRLEDEVWSLRKMNEELSKEKEALKTVAEGQMKVRFNPLVNFPGGLFSWDWRPVPVTAYDTTKTIIEPQRQHLFDFFAAGQLGGLWNRKFAHDLAASFEIGARLNIGSLSFSFAPGLASMQSKGLTYYVARAEWSTK